MRKFVVFFVAALLLGVAGSALGDGPDACYWTGDAGPGSPFWNVAGNWAPAPPGSSTVVRAIAGYPSPYGPTVNNPGAVAGEVQVGDVWGCSGEMTVTPTGILTVGGNLIIAYAGSATGVLDSEGAIEVGGWFYVGLIGDGLLNMDGGTIDVAGLLDLGAQNFAISSHVNFRGGTVTAGGLNLISSGAATADFTEGVLIVDEDETNVGDIDFMIANDYWTAYNGTGTVMVDEGVINPGYVTVWGVPEPATIALLGLGGLTLLRRHKSA